MYWFLYTQKRVMCAFQKLYFSRVQIAWPTKLWFVNRTNFESNDLKQLENNVALWRVECLAVIGQLKIADIHTMGKVARYSFKQKMKII